jgi:chromosome segregation ATPase
LKDAKEKITKHAAEATMREEEHKTCMKETCKLLDHMREHEETYRTDSREYKNQKSIIEQQRQKLEKLEVKMANLVADMARFRTEAKDALDVYDDMKGLRANVTARRVIGWMALPRNSRKRSCPRLRQLK